MKIAIIILSIIVIISSIVTICLAISNANNVSWRKKYKSNLESVKAENEELHKQVNMFARENKRLKEEAEKATIPATIIKEVVVNPKIEKFAVKRILTAEVIRFGGEEHKEMVKKEMLNQLIKDVVENGYVEFYEDKDLYNMEETITARIDVMRR